MTMTQHYLAGELSLLLARLQAAATNQASVRDIAHLRHEVETGPLAVLTSVMARALELANDRCARPCRCQPVTQPGRRP